MKKITLSILMMACGLLLQAQTVFINEIHYDNAGGDVGEGVEVAGPAGTDLTGWTIEFYNGANGLVYDTSTYPAPSTTKAAAMALWAFCWRAFKTVRPTDWPSSIVAPTLSSF